MPFDVPTQVVVDDWNPSAGQSPDDPVQLSATSHWPADGRQVVVEALKPSTQFPAPSQESVPSQGPPFEVPMQGVVAGWKPDGGQSPEVPEQVPARSHEPVGGRHVVVAGWKPSTQWPAPSQESVPSQGPPFDVPTQVVVEGWNPSAGHVPEVPVQLSATSQSPAD